MNMRVKVFTYASRTGSTLIESDLEDHINEWLAQAEGEIVHMAQSESERQGSAHVTITVWYVPKRAGAAV